ncbi:MoaD/ThiS family protein [Asanoa sp. NPDC049518]|uniref:MoaD/ThiS family protein n=1 Tax=unclassified Asanoa TaxID=2685164 RepID=UPI003445FE4C
MGNPVDGAASGVVTVRFFAGARAAAGVAETSVAAGLTHDGFVAALAERHGDRLATVLKVASFLVDGVAWRDGQRPLPAGAEVDVLPPFAGG